MYKREHKYDKTRCRFKEHASFKDQRREIEDWRLIFGVLRVFKVDELETNLRNGTRASWILAS